MWFIPWYAFLGVVALTATIFSLWLLGRAILSKWPSFGDEFGACGDAENHTAAVALGFCAVFWGGIILGVLALIGWGTASWLGMA